MARTEGQGAKLTDLIAQPSLTIRGFSSASVGATARNVIPATAEATIDLRLVKGIDFKMQQDRLIAHIKKQGYYVTEKEPDMDTRLTYPKIAQVKRGSGYNAARTSLDLPVSKLVIRPSIRLADLWLSCPLWAVASRFICSRMCCRHRRSESQLPTMTTISTALTKTYGSRICGTELRH